VESIELSRRPDDSVAGMVECSNENKIDCSRRKRKIGDATLLTPQTSTVGSGVVTRRKSFKMGDIFFGWH
jgi:hypothetical protein